MVVSACELACISSETIATTKREDSMAGSMREDDKTTSGGSIVTIIRHLFTGACEQI